MSRTIQLTELQKALDTELHSVADYSCTWTEDVAGNRFGWLHLPDPFHLLSAAAIMSKYKARLLTITAFAEERDDQDKKRRIAYHFVIENTVVTITIRIYDPLTFEKLPVPSITSLFRNADWNEREFHEMFDIDIINHPNPQRLFLDERLDAGIMSSLIPFSTMSNGMSSQGLWERVMEEKAGYKPSLGSGVDNKALEARDEEDNHQAEAGQADTGQADAERTDALQEGEVTADYVSQAELAFTPVSATAHMTESARQPLQEEVTQPNVQQSASQASKE